MAVRVFSLEVQTYNNFWSFYGLFLNVHISFPPTNQTDNALDTVVLKAGLSVNINYRSLVLKRGFFRRVLIKKIPIKKSP